VVITEVWFIKDVFLMTISIHEHSFVICLTAIVIGNL
jgi:hypothetical protein